jgi:hypothetical protein
MSDDTPTPEEKRAAWIAGTRKVADLLKAHPDLPVPLISSIKGAVWNVYGNGARVAAVEAMLGIPLTGAIDPGDDNFYILSGELDGMPAEIHAFSSHVAERKVTGTRTVEDVEWIRLPVENETPEGEASE